MSLQLIENLPPLREDLGLFNGPSFSDGSPSWTIHDPVRNRYHRIGEQAFEILRNWHLGSVSSLLDVLGNDNRFSLERSDIEWMVQFLHSNMLIQRKHREDVDSLGRIAQASKMAWHKSLLHNYLFFRIPVVRPQRFLRQTKWLGDLVFSQKFLAGILLLGLIGGYLVSRQWDTFLTTFMHFFTWEGVAYYGAALLFSKVLHEFGHAYTAHRAGCRVPSMGVAFLVMWPVLYTDTSDAWRLRDKKKRLKIGAAGMVAELGLALVATFLWSFLPEGPMKSAAFLVASVTWVMTIAINLNPFMRFDGYYLLSDWLEVENLQDRAFARAKWWLRERLFGLGEDEPEHFKRNLGNLLLFYAIGTWVYRFFLFLGIAVLVYAFFFKLLGIFLFLVEILWFVILPIWRETQEWWKRKETMKWNKQSIRTILLICAGFVVLAFPWQGKVTLPGILDAGVSENLFSPMPAQLDKIYVQQGDHVKKGDLLFELASEEIDFQIKQSEHEIKLREELVKREAAGGQERQQIRILRQDLERQKTHLASLQKGRDLLTIRSNIDGQVVELDENLSLGMWVNEEQLLARIVTPMQPRLSAYVDERILDRLTEGSEAVFYPEDVNHAKIKARIDKIAPANLAYLDRVYQASLYGGEIAVEADSHNRLVPLMGTYRVDFSAQTSSDMAMQVLRGDVVVEAKSQSPLMGIMTHIWAVLIRESGF